LNLKKKNRQETDDSLALRSHSPTGESKFQAIRSESSADRKNPWEEGVDLAWGGIPKRFSGRYRKAEKNEQSQEQVATGPVEAKRAAGGRGVETRSRVLKKMTVVHLRGANGRTISVQQECRGEGKRRTSGFLRVKQLKDKPIKSGTTGTKDGLSRAGKKNPLSVGGAGRNAAPVKRLTEITLPVGDGIKRSSPSKAALMKDGKSSEQGAVGKGDGGSCLLVTKKNGVTAPHKGRDSC